MNLQRPQQAVSLQPEWRMLSPARTLTEALRMLVPAPRKPHRTTRSHDNYHSDDDDDRTELDPNTTQRLIALQFRRATQFHRTLFGKRVYTPGAVFDAIDVQKLGCLNRPAFAEGARRLGVQILVRNTVLCARFISFDFYFSFLPSEGLCGM